MIYQENYNMIKQLNLQKKSEAPDTSLKIKERSVKKIHGKMKARERCHLCVLIWLDFIALINSSKNPYIAKLWACLKPKIADFEKKKRPLQPFQVSL